MEDAPEAYEFNWVGKQAARAEVLQPIKKTLRPVKEDSVDWDNTQNLYIEGDNLEVLKLLQKSYLGKVKMIYIDPPYNTGNDFVYHDDYSLSTEEYEELAGALDEYGNKYFKNTDSNGKYHSDWCSMIYSRLLVSRSLLSDDGFIFISIDDNEQSNLKKICDEVFGESCFVGNIIRATGTTTAQGTDSLGKSFDYALMYAKSVNYVVGGIELSEKDKSRYDLSDERGAFSILQLRRTGGEDRREDRPSMYYGIKAPDGSVVFPKGPTGYDSRWRVGEETFKKMLEKNEIYFKQTDEGYKVYYKFYLEGRKKRPSNLWNDIEGNKKAQIDLKALIPEKVFDTPKPIEFIQRLAQIGNVSKNDIVLHFSELPDFGEIEAMEETPDLEFPGAEDSQVEYLLEEDEIDPETTEPEDRKQDIRPIPRYSFLTGPEYHHRYRVIYSHPYQLIFEVLMTDPTETLPDLPVSFYRKLSDSPSLWMCLIYPVALDFPAQELENEFDQVIDWYNSL